MNEDLRIPSPEFIGGWGAQALLLAQEGHMISWSPAATWYPVQVARELHRMRWSLTGHCLHCQVMVEVFGYDSSAPLKRTPDTGLCRRRNTTP
jgi:hypothetical protein